MQSVSDTFATKSKGAIRRIDHQVRISFLKNFDVDIDFFTIGTSLIGGGDIIKGSGSVVQEWDKYDYEDYTDRILSIEYNREAELPTAPLILSTADIVFDNHDDYFTPENTSSPIYGKVRPKRPVRLYLGFKGAGAIPVFTGLTEGMPKIDEKAKTATFHCIDFMQSIINTPLQEEIIFEDKRTDEIIGSLLQTAGLSASQYSLDTGAVIIPFAYFKKDSKLGDALREVAEAELGIVYMSEDGTITFENRTNWASKTSVWGLDKSNVLDITTPDAANVINVVEVFSQAREVQAKQKLWEASNSIEVPPNTSVDVFADFQDEYGAIPVTSVDAPAYITGATTSLFATNTQRDGDGDNNSSAISLSDTDLFSSTYKMTFTNSDSVPMFITQLEVFATPAKVVADIYLRKQDDDSVDIHDEIVHKVENNYIQDETAANSIAQIILEDRAEQDDQREMIIKGIPQLQVGDVITYTDSKVNEAYFVTKVNGILSDSGLRQTLRVSKRTINEYFRIGISLIGGTDKIAP